MPVRRGGVTQGPRPVATRRTCQTPLCFLVTPAARGRISKSTEMRAQPSGKALRPVTRSPWDACAIFMHIRHFSRHARCTWAIPALGQGPVCNPPYLPNSPLLLSQAGRPARHRPDKQAHRTKIIYPRRHAAAHHFKNEGGAVLNRQVHTPLGVRVPWRLQDAEGRARQSRPSKKATRPACSACRTPLQAELRLCSVKELRPCAFWGPQVPLQRHTS